MALAGLAFTNTALDGLETIPLKIRVRIIKKARSLIDEKFPRGAKKLNCTAVNNQSIYRLRSGDYRILYLVRKNPVDVVVLDIGHRKDVYRNR